MSSSLLLTDEGGFAAIPVDTSLGSSVASRRSLRPVEEVSVGARHRPLPSNLRPLPPDKRSDTEGVLRSLNGLRERLSSSSSAAAAGHRDELKAVADVYTELLQRRWQLQADNQSLAVGGDANGLQRSLFGSAEDVVSSVERARHNGGGNSAASFAGGAARGGGRTSSPALPDAAPPAQLHLSAPLGSVFSSGGQAVRPLQLDRTLSEQSAVSLLRVNESQRSRLREYGADLRRELSRARRTATSPPPPPPAARAIAPLRPSATRPIEQQQPPTPPLVPVEQPRKEAKSRRRHARSTADKATATATATTKSDGVADSMPFNPDTGEVDFDALRRRLDELKAKFLATREAHTSPPSTHDVDRAPPIAAKNSPQTKRHRSVSPSRPKSSRSPRKKDCALPKKPPFIACTSIGASHSLTVNLQRLLAVLKAQNPLLHQICLRLGPGVPTSQLARAFRAELVDKMAQLEAQLETDLLAYDDCQKKADPDDGQLARLSQRIEQTDTMIQRLQDQLARLSNLLRTEAPVHPARRKAVHMAKPFATHIFDHTVASEQRVSECRRRPERRVNAVDGPSACDGLRRLRALQSALAPLTP